MALQKANNTWSEGWIKDIYDRCQVALKIVDSNPLVSENYRDCLRRGRESIIEKMTDLIINIGYFTKQYDAELYVLYWRDAPQCIGKFVQHLESVFTGDKEIKIRMKTLDLAGRVAGNVPPLPNPTEDWNGEAIQILYDDCQRAMKLLEKNPAIISDKYRQCLERGRDVIIENIMKLVMDTEYFKKHDPSTEYQLYWEDAPRWLASFLRNVEAVFTRDEGLKIGEKISRKQIAIPAIASIVALVEEPDRRLKCGILKKYKQMEFLSPEDKLELLRGKSIFNGKWIEDDETYYNLSGDSNAMLCMHLWSLMRYAGFSKPEKIWDVISRGWAECVTWKQGPHGMFWKLIQSDKDKVPLREQAARKGMKTILDVYKDMERHFKGSSEYSLMHYKDAYYPDEAMPAHMC